MGVAGGIFMTAGGAFSWEKSVVGSAATATGAACEGLLFWVVGIDARHFAHLISFKARIEAAFTLRRAPQEGHSRIGSSLTLTPYQKNELFST
jgi:hypothetical protein